MLVGAWANQPKELVNIRSPWRPKPADRVETHIEAAQCLANELTWHFPLGQCVHSLAKVIEGNACCPYVRDSRFHRLG